VRVYASLARYDKSFYDYGDKSAENFGDDLEGGASRDDGRNGGRRGAKLGEAAADAAAVDDAELFNADDLNQARWAFVRSNRESKPIEGGRERTFRKTRPATPQLRFESRRLFTPTDERSRPKHAPRFTARTSHNSPILAHTALEPTMQHCCASPSLPRTTRATSVNRSLTPPIENTSRTKTFR